MSGKFEGLSDEQWEIIAQLLPKQPKRVGRPNPDLRKVLNTIFYVQITGCRWCDVPIGEQWGKRSTSHEWLGILQNLGVFEKIKNSILSTADLFKMINWDRASVDGSFSPRKRRRSRC